MQSLFFLMLITSEVDKSHASEIEYFDLVELIAYK
jgi:hypothetical protein